MKADGRVKFPRQNKAAIEQNLTTKTIRIRKKKVKNIKTEVNVNPCNQTSDKSPGSISSVYCEMPSTFKTSSTLPKSHVTPPTQPKMSTLPRAGKIKVKQPTHPTSLRRTPKPPRRLSGYVSPAVSLKRHSKMESIKDQCKGINFKAVGNISNILKKSSPSTNTFLPNTDLINFFDGNMSKI